MNVSSKHTGPEFTCDKSTGRGFTGGGFTGGRFTRVESPRAFSNHEVLTAASIFQNPHKPPTDTFSHQNMFSGLNQSMSSGNLSYQAISNRAMSNQAMPNQAMSSQAMSNQAMSSQAMSYRAMANQAMPNQAITNQAMANQAMLTANQNIFRGSSRNISTPHHNQIRGPIPNQRPYTSSAQDISTSHQNRLSTGNTINVVFQQEPQRQPQRQPQKIPQEFKSYEDLVNENAHLLRMVSAAATQELYTRSGQANTLRVCGKAIKRQFQLDSFVTPERQGVMLSEIKMAIKNTNNVTDAANSQFLLRMRSRDAVWSNGDLDDMAWDMLTLMAEAQAVGVSIMMRHVTTRSFEDFDSFEKRFEAAINVLWSHKQTCKQVTDEQQRLLFASAPSRYCSVNTNLILPCFITNLEKKKKKNLRTNRKRSIRAQPENNDQDSSDDDDANTDSNADTTDTTDTVVPGGEPGIGSESPTFEPHPSSVPSSTSAQRLKHRQSGSSGTKPGLGSESPTFEPLPSSVPSSISAHRLKSKQSGSSDTKPGLGHKLPMSELYRPSTPSRSSAHLDPPHPVRRSGGPQPRGTFQASPSARPSPMSPPGRNKGTKSRKRGFGLDDLMDREGDSESESEPPSKRRATSSNSLDNDPRGLDLRP